MKPSSEHSLHASELWVITSYYNPVGYERRLGNYRLFRRRLTAPLLTVEMSVNQEFVLDRDDADVLVQCPAGDVLWQKERLLNHALSHLPRSCRYVAWVDCDLLFRARGWMAEVKAALERFPILQPFSRVFHAPCDAALPEAEVPSHWMMQPSISAAMSAGRSFEACMNSMMLRTGGTVAVGMAWAARRELLQRHGFFDACIIGGGDTAFACAAFGQPELAMQLHHMNANQRAVYQAWAEPFRNEAGGAVSHTSGDLIHLWHGDVQDRRPSARHHGLKIFDFDPRSDLQVASGGAWRWASDKPDLHAYLRNYFASRHEDGRVAQPA